MAARIHFEAFDLPMPTVQVGITATFA